MPPASDRLDRVIVVRAKSDAETNSYVEKIFASAGRQLPHALVDWEAAVTAWCAEYRARTGPTQIVEIDLDPAVYLFDRAAERVVLAYALSTEQLLKRDRNRMRGFPDVN